MNFIINATKKQEKGLKQLILSLETILIKLLCLMLEIWHLLLSPLFGARCRFHPTCSNYAKEALAEHGLLKGTWLSIKRVCRCNQLFEGGIDPIPRKTSERI